jgi:hypothetical protein
MGNTPTTQLPKSGYQILQVSIFLIDDVVKVHKSSPGENAGLKSFFDFIVGSGDILFVISTKFR